MPASSNERRVIELALRATGDAEIRRMQSELTRLRLAAQDSANSLGGLQAGFGKLATFAKGFVGAIGVQQIIGWSRAILDAADALDAAAEQAGIGVERYQTLKEAFRSLEVDAGKFETGMERLATALSDTLAGDTNKATEALDRLGIKAKILSGEIQTTDELVDALAQSQKALGDDVTFTSDMVDIFGRKLGVDYANALRDGKLATAEMTAAMAEFGVVSEEEIAKLSAASETVEQFQTRAGNAILIFSANAITALEDFGSAAAEVFRRYANGEALFWAYHNQRMAGIERSAREGRQAGIDANLNMLGVGSSSLDSFLRDLRPPPVVPRTGGARPRGGGARAGGGGRADNSAERDAKKAAEEQARQIAELGRQIEETRERRERDAEAIRDQTRALEEAANPGLKYLRLLDELNVLRDKGGLSEAAYRAELERLNDERREANRLIVENSDAERKRREEQERARAELERVQQQWGFVADAMAQATYDIITGTEKIGQAVKKMVATIVSELIRVQLTKFAIGLFGGGGGGGGGGFGSIVAGILKGSLSASGNIFGRGGIIDAPMMHGTAGGGIGIAGEAGPEAIVPLARGPGGKLGLASPGVKVTVNNYAGAEVAVRQTGGGIEIDVIRKVLADDIRRGGSTFAAALEQTYRVGRQASAR